MGDRKPALIWNRQPDLWFAPPVDRAFGMLLAQSVFTHLDVRDIAACFAELHRVMAPDARFFFTYNTGKASSSSAVPTIHILAGKPWRSWRDASGREVSGPMGAARYPGNGAARED